MADFDPKDIVKKPRPISDFDEEDVVQQTSPLSDFDDEDVVSIQKPAVEVVSGLKPEEKTQEDIRKEIQTRGIFNKPVLGAEYTSPQELEAIAKKYNVDPTEFKTIAPYYGARISGEDFFSPAEVKRTLGGVGQLAFNVPQWLYKKTQEPQMQQALDELSKLTSGRQSYVQVGGELIAPIGAVRKGSSLLSAAGQLAAMGAVGGVASSETGKELEGAIQGAIVTPLAAGALVGAGKLAGAGVKKIYNSVKNKSLNAEEAVKLTPQKEAEEVGRLGVEIESLKTANKSSDDKIGEFIVDQERRVDPTIVAGKDRKNIPISETQVILSQSKSADELAEALNSTTDIGKELLKRADPKIAQELGERAAIEARLAQDVVDARKQEFAEWLTGTTAKTVDDANEAILGFAKTESAKDGSYLKRMYDEFLNETYAKNILEESGGARTSKIIRRSDDALQRAANFISDVQYPIDDISRRTGYDVAKINRKLQKHTNWVTYPRQFFNKLLANLEKETRDLGDDIVDEAGGKVYDYITGKTTTATPDVVEAAKKASNYFNQVADFVEGKEIKTTESGWFGKTKDISQKLHAEVLPVTVERIKNYAPRIQVDVPILVSRAENKLDRVLKASKAIWGKDLKDLTPSEFTQFIYDSPQLQELLQYMNRFETKPIENSQDFRNSFNLLFRNSGGISKMESKSGRLMERTDEPLPEWTREKNIYKLANKYANNLIRHVYLREPITELNIAARTLEKAGADLDARLIKNLVSDIMGIRPGTLSAYSMKKVSQYNTAVDKSVDVLGDKLGMTQDGKLIVSSVFKVIPDIISGGINNIYQTTLGMRSKAIIVNLTQPFTRVAPELGNAYGYTTVMRGAAYVRQNLPHLFKLIEQEGLVPASYYGEYNRALADGIRRNPIYATLAKAFKVPADISMIPYQASETLNRMISRGTAEMMAHDLTNTSSKMHQLAIRSLQKFPMSIKNAVQKAGNNQKLVAKILADHLNSKTMFNYNRPAMSEYGRTMGPVFSQLSKWPTAIAGETINDIRTKGIVGGFGRGITRLGIPYALFQLVDYMIATGGDIEKALAGAPGVPFVGEEIELGDKQKVLTGGSGLAGTTPVTALTGFIEGDIFTPPAIDLLVSKTILPFLKADDNEARQEVVSKAFDQARKTYTPLYQYYRFFAEEYPVLFEGKSRESTK